MCHNVKYSLSEAKDLNKVFKKSTADIKLQTKLIVEMKDSGMLLRKDNSFCSSETHSVHQTDLYAVVSPVRFFYRLDRFQI